MWPTDLFKGHTAKRLAKSLRGPRDEAFVTSCKVPSHFLIPEKFDPSRHGIILCETIRSGSDVYLNLYWKSAERQRAHLAAVHQALNIDGSEVVGPVVQVVTPKQVAFLRDPARWGQVLLTVAALFGVLTAIRDYFAEIFVKPAVFAFPTSATDDIRSNSHIDIPLSLRNQANLGQAQVELKGAELQPLNVSLPIVHLQLDFEEIPQLASGQSLEIHVRGAAPSLPPGLHSPQAYRLDLQATAKEGWLRSKEPVVSSPRSFMLWPELGFEAESRKLSADVVQTDIFVYAGRGYPKGLQGVLEFVSPVEPDIGSMVITGGGQALGSPIAVRRNGAYISKLEFRTEALEPLQRIRVAVSVGYTRPLTESEWLAIKSTTRVTME